MAQLANKTAKGNWDGYDNEAWAKQQKQFNDFLEESTNVDPDVSLVGAVVSFPYADSAAHYRVSKDKPLTLQHIPFCDGWQVDYAMIRGLRKTDIIARMIRTVRLR